MDESICAVGYNVYLQASSSDIAYPNLYTVYRCIDTTLYSSYYNLYNNAKWWISTYKYHYYVIFFIPSKSDLQENSVIL